MKPSSQQQVKLEQFLAERGYLTINQLEEYLCFFPTRKVSYPTIKRYLMKGYLICEQVGGQYRILKDSIESYIEHGTNPVGEKGEATSASPISLIDPEPFDVLDDSMEPLVKIKHRGEI